MIYFQSETEYLFKSFGQMTKLTKVLYYDTMSLSNMGGFFMKKMKQLFVILLIGVLFLTPNVVNAKEKTTKEVADKINWEEPVRVKLLEQKSNNLFVVQYEDEKFEVSMIGIDIAEKYVIKRYHQEEDGKLSEFSVNYLEEEIYSDLQKSGTILLELDKGASKYNNNGAVQAWFWGKGQLIQAKLVGEGRARIDKDICSYTACDNHYTILKSEEANAKKNAVGIHSAKDIKYLENVGGKKRMFSNLINLAKENIVLVSAIGGGVLLAIVLIVMIILQFKNKDKRKAKKEAKKQMKLEKKQKKEAMKQEKIAQKQAKKNPKKTEPVQDAKPVNEIQPEIKSETTAPVEQSKEEQDTISEEEPKKKGLKNAIMNALFEEVEEEEPKKEIVDTVVIPADSPTNIPEENIVDVTEPTSNLEEMPKSKTLFLKVVGTVFDAKSDASKEDSEVINIEYMFAGEDSTYKEVFVKPMRQPILSDVCKQRTGYTQEVIDKGYLLEEAIQKLLEDARDCDEVYVWGTQSVDLLLKDASSKLTDMDYNRLEYLLNKTVNFKTNYAQETDTKPCGLIKAVEDNKLEKDESQVKMMNTLYLSIRGE